MMMTMAIVMMMIMLIIKMIMLIIMMIIMIKLWWTWHWWEYAPLVKYRLVYNEVFSPKRKSVITIRRSNSMRFNYTISFNHLTIITIISSSLQSSHHHYNHLTIITIISSSLQSSHHHYNHLTISTIISPSKYTYLAFVVTLYFLKLNFEFQILPYAC